MQHFAILAGVLTIVLLIICGWLGQILSLRWAGVKSIFGIGFVLGYSVFGLILLVSLRLFGTPIIGATLFLSAVCWIVWRESSLFQLGWRECWSKRVLVCKWIHWRRIRSFDFSGSDVINGMIILIMISWVVMVSLVYLPLLSLVDSITYQFPDVFDLPKHYFAAFSLFYADDWPPPNPFFAGQSFAYNFLFYVPIALIARIFGDPTIIYVALPLVFITLAFSVPLVVLDIVKAIGCSKIAQLFSVLLVTWIGGLTPLFVNGWPPIGFVFFVEQLVTSPIWVDEVFQSVIYVPQHVFAVLCGMVTIFILASSGITNNLRSRIIAGGICTSAGMLSSFILVPHLLVSYVLGLVILALSCYRYWREVERTKLWVGAAFASLMPVPIVLPFIIESVAWMGNSGSLFVVPELSLQWFYVVAAFGLVVPLSIYGMVRWGKAVLLPNKALVRGMIGLVIIGWGGLFFGGYPDAGIKSGLWVRLTLVPIASVGIGKILSHAVCTWKAFLVRIAVALAAISLMSINLPTVHYFALSAWRPIDPTIASAIRFIRSLPDCARVALLSSEQIFAAIVGRQLDFDFRSIRADSYMPVSGRQLVGRFWDGLAMKDPDAFSMLVERYHYLVIPSSATLGREMTEKLVLLAQYGNYFIYATKSFLCRNCGNL